MTDDQEHSGSLGLGERLRRAREAMGRSTEEMAEELRLTVEKVEALEAEDYCSLPAEPYVRGYLRNYAAALGLSTDEVMAAYEQRPAGGDEGAPENDTPIIPEPEKPLIEHPWRVVWASLALLVVVSVFTVWLVGAGKEPGLPDKAGAPSEGEEVASAPAPDSLRGAAPESGTEPDEGEIGGTATSGGSQNGEGSAEGAFGPNAATASGATAATASGQAQDGRAEGATLSGPGLARPEVPTLSGPEKEGTSLPKDLQTLRVHTWAQAWMEVADDRGRVLLKRLVGEGRDVRLYGQAPFQVKVGNAAAVQLYFEDQPLPPLGRPGQVVRLTVDADSRTIPQSQVGPPDALAAARKAGENTTAPDGSEGSGPDSPASQDGGATAEPAGPEAEDGTAPVPTDPAGESRAEEGAAIP